MKRRVHSGRLGAFLAAVFAVKLSVVWQLKDHVLLQPDAGLDTSVYLELARRVAGGDVALGPGLYYVSPLYIYFVAAVLALTDSLTAVRVLQTALGTASVALIWWMAREWFGGRAAWIAATLAALTGIFTFYETLLLQAALDPFLTACALAALTVALKSSRTSWFLLAGLAFGVQALNRPNVLLAAGGIALLLVAIRHVRGALLLTAGLLAALAPVTLRNAVVAGDWSPVSSHGGLNFYIGNNADADGTYHAVPGITPSIVGQQADARRVAEQATGRPLNDAEVSAYFYRLGRSWIAARPKAALALLLRKLAYVFDAAHLSLNYSYPFYARDAGTLLRVLVVGPWLLIPLGLTGLAWQGWRLRAGGVAVWAGFVPLYALSVAVFFVSERYRLPLLVPLCAGSAAALDAIVSAFAARRVRDAAVLTVTCVALLGAVNWPLGLDDARAEERTRMAERMIRLGDFAEGERWSAEAEKIHPAPGLVHFRVGRAFLAAGRADLALAHLRKAAEVDPNRPEVDFALGQALLETGRAADAVPHLRRAYDARVRVDLSGFDLARALAASGDRTAAMGVLQNVRPGRDDDADSWFALGQLAFDLRAPSLAEAFYIEAAKTRPAFSAARRQLGLTYVLMGRFADAAHELEKAVSLDPADPAAQLNLAVAYAEVGRIDEARAHAREALRLEPGYEKARQLLGVLK